ncbi:nucleotidyltransferase family protein [Marivibrio halodurans]|uniref:Nucleotidyltransferase family protein n=1 Tax=Marivibrio halodurans TaxID=2039722 RepID=A0A8J7RWE8_9PROT|nr:nucleotidyltransferase family protein [Marivibrio halodurans]MBP5855640.1 nucleotidyltransferase family protein [Marivibrio halodurans]
MRALLLAAGMGSRLRPITDTTPKCLVEVHGRPLLDYWFELLLRDRAVSEILVNTHYLHEKVEAFIAESPWRDRVAMSFEPDLLGTAGTIKANGGFHLGEPLLVAHADNLTQLDVPSFLAKHDARPPEAALTMLTFHTDMPRQSGIVELDESGLVQAFHEKVDNPPGDLANAAVYILTPEVLADIDEHEGPFIDLSTEIIPRYVGRIFATAVDGYHRGIETVEGLERAHREFRPNKR